MELDYHKDISSISKSGLDLVHKAPIFYKHFRLDAKDFTSTKPLIIGQASHMYLLEKDDFFLNYSVSDRKTSEGNINMEDFKHMENQSKIIHSIPEFASIFKNGITEKTYKSRDLETGAAIKCRVDLIDESRGIIIDPKFVEDASPRGFKHSAYKYRYHVQDVFYKRILQQNGIKINHFIFLAIEKKPPYAYGLYVINEEMHQYAELEINEDLSVYVECMRTGVWNSYTSKVMEL